MKIKLPLIFFLLLSCQGPWSYFPENPENYQGIWVSAFIVSGRPVEHICFDKMHALDEARLPRFAFYEAANVEITGSFNGEVQTIPLSPDIFRNPNCFGGWGRLLLAEAGKEYELNASITWDSAGKRTTSKLHAKTAIPQKFEVKRAYDLTGRPHSKEDSRNGKALFSYLPPPMDMKSNYFVPEYSDDVAGALVSMVYGSNVYWGENSMTQLASQFTGESNDTTTAARLAQFGDREMLYCARNMKIMGAQNEIDSIPIMGLRMPAEGWFKLLFYATTGDYLNYRDSYLNGADDPRIKAIYNIEGGAGIFAGMLVDTFDVHIQASPDLKIFPHKKAQEYYCNRMDDEFGVEYWKVRRQCIEIWDQKIQLKLYCEETESSYVCPFSDFYEWHEIPREDLEKALSKDEQITWCEHRNFPIYESPLCGSALVRFSKSGKKSTVLDREVKKWCDENKDDPECV